MDQAFLAQRPGQYRLGGIDQPGGAIGDDQQRRAQPPAAEPVEEVAPRVSGLAAAGGQRDKYRCAVGGDAPRGEHRLGPGTGMHLEHRGVQEQVVQLHAVQAPG